MEVNNVSLHTCCFLQQIGTSKLIEMKAKLSQMSQEEIKERMAALKAKMSTFTPEQLEKMKSMAKKKLREANSVKASDVVIGVVEKDDAMVRPVHLDGATQLSIVPNAAADEDFSALDTEQLYDRLETLPFGTERDQFMAKLNEEQRSALEDHINSQNPAMALMTTACKGTLEQVKALIEAGADVNYSEDTGDSILMMACWFGKHKIVCCLLEHKARVGHRNEHQQTALHYAAMKGHIKIIQALMKYGAGLEDKDDKGYTPAHCAAQFGHTALLDFFKRKGANLFATDKENHTILHWTAYNKHPLATSWILNEGVEIHAKDSKGRTAIHWAAKQGNDGILKILVEFIDEEGFTGLLHEGDNEGKSPLDLAKYFENHKATRYIKQVLRRQHGCAAVWNRITCQSGIRPGEDMRTTARMVSAWLLIVMGLSFLHLYFVIRPYSPTIPSGCYPAMYLMVVLCYVFWFASNCIDPGYIDPNPGSSAYNKITKKKKGRKKPKKRTRQGGYAQADVHGADSDPEIEMKLFDEDEEAQENDDFKEVKLDVNDESEQFPEDAPSWTLPYDVLLERGRFDAICVTCGIVKPLRSKHCKHCNRCVSRFDHHCPWIDNCVAENNRKQFVLLCVTQTTSTWFYAVLVGIHLHYHSCSDWLAFTLGLPLMVHACLVATWGVFLTWEHISLAWSNITTNEKMNQHRYSYMRTPEGFAHNPFNQGVSHNCLYFFGCKEETDWRKLNINTKFLPPGKKSCCGGGGGHQGGGHQGCEVDAHGHGQAREERKELLDSKKCCERGGCESESQEGRGLLAGDDVAESGVNLGAGVGL